MMSYKEHVREVVELELTQCTRQPGNLRITKEACALQYNYAQKRLLKNGKNTFRLGGYSSLEVCRKCPKGRRYFEALNEGQTQSKNDHKSRRTRLFKATRTAHVNRGGKP